MKNQNTQKGSTTLGWTVSAVVVGVVIIALATVVGGGRGNQSANVQSSVDKISESDWVRGSASSSVSLIEYGDFECPACATFAPIVKTIEGEFENRIAFVYRQFPLRTIHTNADITAQATEAAGLQGKFWEMHDMIYAKQTEWAGKSGAKDMLVGYAKELGLDIEAFKVALESDAVRDAVQADVTSGLSAGVNSTPTFYLNGERILPQSSEQLRAFIEAALSATTPTQ